MAKNEIAKERYREYKKGFSLSEIGKMFGVTRQSVYEMFKVRNLKLREKKKLPFLTFNKKKYTLRKNGYYGLTDGKRTMMHRDVWEYNNGKIPKSHDIHHINNNKTDNRLENLELYSKPEHAKKFSIGHNQYTKCKK